MKKLISFKKSTLIWVIALILVTIASSVGITAKVMAEQSGGSPESGVTSRIKSLYDDLVALSYGSDVDAPDWGAYWNRIKTSAKWVPNGAVTVTDVKAGITFYNTSRTQAIGTYPNPTSCSTQAYHDSYGPPVTEETNCSLTWTSPGGASGTDKEDPRTDLIWSYPLYRNGTVIEFSNSTNTSFSWDNSHANNQGITAPVAGNRTAIQLCADQGNGWRLPTQKELMQAYIDGSFWNLNQPSNVFWSATEYSAANAWNVTLNNGTTTVTTKTSTTRVRCVR